MKPTLLLQAHTALIALLACLAALHPPCHAQIASSPWQTPAAQLATQIASILGPGQAQIELTNRSSIPASELPAIRRAIEDALRSHGVKPGSQESANTLRITLSENTTERLWIAEIFEGAEVQIAIVRLDKPASGSTVPNAASSIRLEHKLLWSSQHRPADLPSDNSPILAALEWNHSLLLLSADRLTLLTSAGEDWNATTSDLLTRPADARPMPRDPRGSLYVDPATSAVTAYLPGLRCASKILIPAAGTTGAPASQAICQTSDDPWPLLSTAAAQKAFYNAARNYFTGVLTSGVGSPSPTVAPIGDSSPPPSGVDLPPFYTALPVTASGASALLIAAVDGKARLAASSGIRLITGSHDWGSGLASLITSCGTTVILASSSGEAREDSLRAYDLHGSESIAISEPLSLKGSITALNSSVSASNPNSVLAILRISPQEYEVDRVSALCQ